MKLLASIAVFPMQILILLVSLSACTSNTKKRDAPPRPNVLFISVDDLNDWIEPLGGNPQAKTPNLLAFSKEAVNFNNAYCASPGCNPSRGAILTGLHTYTTGLYSNYQDWRKIPKMIQSPTLNQYFRSNGYYTAGAGKIYHYEQVDTAGWMDYFPSKTKPMPDDNFPVKRPASMPPFKYMYNMADWAPLDISDEETGDFQSVNYIREQLRKTHDKPFFLACGIYRPHLPWHVPRKYFDMFPLDSIQLPKLQKNDTTDLGVFARKELVERGGNYHKHIVAAGQWKKAIQGYLASIAFADAMVGLLLQELSQSAYSKNTIVVLWSDHGWQLGEKNHWRKFALWENVTRSVLMIQAPKGTGSLPDGSQRGSSTSLVSLIDIYPTLLELCGLPQRTDLDGKSLVPFLNNPNIEVDRPIITTYDYGSYSVRYRNWHYIRYIDDSMELYDLQADPEEWTNRAAQANLEDLVIMMDGFIPAKPVDFPVESLTELQEHHIAPIQSRAHYESKERKDWMKRFENIP